MFGTNPPMDVEMLNNAFVNAVQYINPVIADRSKKYVSLYRGLIPRGTFTYGEGYLKKSQTYHGGIAAQDSGASWAKVEASRPPNPATGDPGHDACRYESQIVGYGFEEKEYELYQTTRRTMDICLTDILFKWQYEKQLSMIYNSLANVTLGEWEDFLREQYLTFCTVYIAANSNTGLGIDTVSYSLGDGYIDIPSGGFTDSIGQLRQTILDRFYQYLSRQCIGGAMGMKGGMPVFGLVTSAETSTELIKNDPNRNDLRYADPGMLIEGYGQVKTWQNWAHIQDAQAPRLKVNDTGTRLVRVYPYETTPTTIGDAVNVSTDYIMAPFEISIVKLKNVYKALIPPPNPRTLARGYKFDPADCFGDFHWINGWDRQDNILREKGFFFGRYRMAAEPLENSTDAIAILHRRCQDITFDLCDVTDAGVTTSVNISACAQYDTSEAAASATVYVITCADELAAGPGEQVTVTWADASTANAIIVADANGPEYVIAFSAGVALGYCAKGGSTMQSVQVS